MEPLFKCELNYIESAHLSQLYAGFEILHHKGIADVTIKTVSGGANKPLLKVRVNNRYDVVYDVLDGLNWTDGDVSENLNYFRSRTKADFYFKRSFNELIREYAPDQCQVFPLGLNYPISPRRLFKRNLRESFKNTLRNNPVFSKVLKLNRSNIHSQEFEYYPVPNKINRILFLTRLWDPSEVKQEHLKAEREAINNYRIDCIRLCQKEFGKYFTGGIQADHFSMKKCRDIVIPFALSKRDFYLKTVKDSNICIATTGLHNSTGFKMGEYVAASRAIVTEPLHFLLPGKFINGQHYFSFQQTDELLGHVHRLYNDHSLLQEMMHNNFNYYNGFLRPDMLILNSLRELIKGE
jgi:hypothetical protein